MIQIRLSKFKHTLVMKNYLKSLVASAVLFLAVAVPAVSLTSCAGSYDKVAGKIENRDSLSQKDYEMMFEYVDEAMDAVDRVSEKYKNDPVRLQTEMNAVNEKYGHLEDFVNAITDADNAGKLDKENDGRLELLQRRLLKMMGLNPDELMKETAHDAENI